MLVHRKISAQPSPAFVEVYRLSTVCYQMQGVRFSEKLPTTEVHVISPLYPEYRWSGFGQMLCERPKDSVKRESVIY